MNETGFDLEKMNKEIWESLDQKEKAVCVNYRRQLEIDAPVNRKIVIKVNIIHERYPEFHVGCIPG